MAEVLEFRGGVSALVMRAPAAATDAPMLTIENGVGSGRTVRIHSVFFHGHDQSQANGKPGMVKLHAALPSGGITATKVQNGGVSSSASQVVVRVATDVEGDAALTAITLGDTGTMVGRGHMVRLADASLGHWMNDLRGLLGAGLELAEGQALSMIANWADARPFVASNANTRYGPNLMWDELTVTTATKAFPFLRRTVRDPLLRR